MSTRRGFMASILAAGFAPAAVGSGVLMPVRRVFAAHGMWQARDDMLEPLTRPIFTIHAGRIYWVDGDQTVRVGPRRVDSRLGEALGGVFARMAPPDVGWFTLTAPKRRM